MKDYKTILEGVVNIINTTEKSDIGFANICSYIGENYPELKESEDERIRKALIDTIKFWGIVMESPYILGIPKEDILAWLEKQGKHANFRNKIQIGDKVTRNEDGVLVNLSQLNRVAKKDEKQDEQKAINTDNKFIRMRETKPKDISEFLDRLTTVEQEFLWEHIAKIRELDKEEQTPTDKAEPKFEIGDYVKNVNDKMEPIYEIVYIDKECYICEYRGKENMGDKAVMHFAFDYPYLRHIQKSTWSEEDRDYYDAIIAKLEVTQDDASLTDNQMEFLKSLKNRVQLLPKQEWSEEDERMYRGLHNLIYSTPYCDSRKELSEWFKSLKERYTWKPSDEQIDALYTYIYNPQYFNSPDPRMELVESVYKDLKKLKE